MSGKGSISRMSDECLITLEFGFPFYTQYQAVMRKFTLATISYFSILIMQSNDLIDFVVYCHNNYMKY